MSDRPHIPAELDTLLAAYCDARLAPAQLGALERRLAADAGAVDLLIDYMQVHAHLGWTLNASRSSASVPPERHRAVIARLPRWRSWLIAAALLIAGGVVAVVVIASRPGASAPRPAIAATPKIATVVDATDGGTLVVGDRVVSVGDDIAAGELVLDSGAASVMLANGADVRVHGGTRLTIHDPRSATLRSGRAAFHCPPAAKGYTVALPDGSRVVDLGTRFRVWFEDGEATVGVTEGSVRIEPATPGAEPMVVTAGGSARRTEAGWSPPPTSGPVARVIAGSALVHEATADRPLSALWGARADEVQCVVEARGHRFGRVVTATEAEGAIGVDSPTVEIAPDAAVDVVLVWFRPETRSTAFGHGRAMLRFDRPIVGVVFDEATLSEMDGSLKATQEAVKFTQINFAAAQAGNVDAVAFHADGQTVEVAMNAAARAGNRVRVLLASPLVDPPAIRSTTHSQVSGND